MVKKEIDLDALAAARREAAGEAPVVRFRGREFEMPAELPFTIVEAVGKINSAEDEKTKNARTAEMLGDVARSLFGDRYQEFIDLRPSTNDIGVLLEKVTDEYGTSVGESSASGTS